MNLIEEKYQAQRLQFIEVVAKNLATNGWNQKLLEKAELECGFEQGYHFILFQDGIRGAIRYFEAWQNKLMLDKLAENDMQPAKVREKIALALTLRIMQMEDKQLDAKAIALQNSTYYGCLENTLFGAEMALSVCDNIWYYAGDKSTDFNYYTKRGLLLPVYLSAVMFYISDTSLGNVDTKNFIEQALANIINIASIKNNVALGQIKLPALEDIPILRMFV